jgi:type I restriction enzyme S subunit
MEVKPGYKQTDIGVIPEDWEATTIGDVASFSGGSQPPRSTFRFLPTNGYIRLIQIRDYKTDNFATFIPESFARKKCMADDIMIGRYGPPIFQILRGIDGAYNVALIKSNPSAKIDREYFYNVLNQDSLFQLIESLSRRSSGQTGVELPALRAFGLPLPPLLEQHAIATALSDVDGLIAGLDQLIAKKRDVKQAAMQQLLTGQTRLAGFRGEWKRRKFNDVATPRKDRINPQQIGIQEFCVELEHIDQATGNLLGNTSTGENASLKSVFYKGDVLFGKLRAYLRKYWQADRPGVCSTEIWVLAPNLKLITSDYLFQTIKTDGFIESAVMSYGTHMPRSDWNIVKNYEARIPPIPEQTAITEVLSDMDAELATLEQRRAKTHALKKGMMHELLTGKTRLPVQL